MTSSITAPGVDSAVPWHLGDPLREQRLLAESAGTVDRSNREVVQISGTDRLTWLHTICSQHVAALADGDATESLVLSPHGHVEQHWQVVELDGTVWLDTEPGASATVLEYLQKMRFLKRVEPVDVTPDWAVLSLVGPRTPEVLAALGLDAPAQHHGVALPGGGVLRTMSWPGPGGADLIVPRADRDLWLQRLTDAGAPQAGNWAFEALRVESRRPRLGFETDHRTIPHEIGFIGSAVHLDKGCYRGQETVARVHNLGRPPRSLVLLHLAGESDELPEPGTPVEAGGRAIGFVGTAVHHYELGPIALAVVKRSIAEQPPGDGSVTVAGAPVSVS